LTLTLVAAAFVVVFQTARSTAASPVADPVAVWAVEQFLSRPRVAHDYQATRRLEASGSGRRAWLDVRTDYSPAVGLRYQVTAEGGSGYIRSRVLVSLLEEEQRLISQGDEHTVALTPDNYRFTAETLNEEGLATVTLWPLRKDRALIAGRMFLTTGGELRRVEGRLARNPSFWVTRVDIVRSYRPINGVLMPVLLETRARLRLLGAAELRMTYRYSSIDEVPVVEPSPTSPSTW
jgi:hypothetical protein